jgi:hypothetical protein
MWFKGTWFIHQAGMQPGKFFRYICVNTLIMKLLTLLFLLVSSCSFAQDSLFVTVHVIYGSKPLVKEESKWFGGRWGGHIGLEVSPGKVVHFFGSGRFRTFEGKADPGVFAISTVEDFYCTFDCDSSRRMAVKIPVAATQYAQLDSIVNSYHENPPYAYAFFGMRCTSACYHLLSWADAVPDHKKGKMVRKFFYPRKLRRYLIRKSKKKGWEITYTKGRKTRKWDHD